MSNSSLVEYTKISPFRTAPRQNKIDRITPHCVVGQCSIEALGTEFSRSNKNASSNYGIGVDGRVGMFVEESDRSWCSSSASNDHRAVTIECASDATHPYAFKAIVYDKLVSLCIDICRRNGKTKLIWFGDKNKTLSYTPKSNEMILTVHRWFYPQKSCPGDWMYDRMGDLAEKVTKALTPIEEGDDEMLSYDKFKEYMDKYVKENPDAIQKIFKDNMSRYRKTLQDNDSANWSADSRNWGIETGLIQGGSSLSDGSPNYMWEDFITREQMTTFMYRFAQNLYRGFSQIFKLSK